MTREGFHGLCRAVAGLPKLEEVYIEAWPSQQEAETLRTAEPPIRRSLLSVKRLTLTRSPWIARVAVCRC